VASTELVPAAGRAAALPPGLGPAAERFARTSLRKSAQTQRTYASTYGRFTAWLTDYTKTPHPQPAAFTADALAAYLDDLEQDRAPATVKKERAALNRLARCLHTLGATDATEILMVETAGPSDKTPPPDALDAETLRARGDARPRAPGSLRSSASSRSVGQSGACGSCRPCRSPSATAAVRRCVSRRCSRRGELGWPFAQAACFVGAQAHVAEDYDQRQVAGRGRRRGSHAGVAHHAPARPAPHLRQPLHAQRRRALKAPGAEGHASSDTTSLYVHHTREGLEAAVAANETAGACWKRTPTGAGLAQRR
jgi:hypothetical protein